MARATQANYLHAVQAAADELTRAQADQTRANARVTEAQARLSAAQTLAGVSAAGSPVAILAQEVADNHANAANPGSEVRYLPQVSDIAGTGRTHS